jgi:hypothetical protein
MYNLQFKEAHTIFEQWRKDHPDDPVGPASDAAAYLFAEFDRLHILQSEFFTHDQHFMTDNKLTPYPVVKQRFDASLEAARKLAARTPNDPNSMFAVVLANGLECDYLALIEKRYSGALKRMKAGRQVAERLLAKDPQYYDAWIAVASENYILSTKAAPVRWVLRIGGAQTDRELGLQKLKLIAEKGRYLAPFARLMLAVAALREKNLPQARTLLESLARDYPKNPLYRQEVTRLQSAAP